MLRAMALLVVLCGLSTSHAQEGLLDDDGTVGALPLWMEEAGDQWSQAHPLLKKVPARRVMQEEQEEQDISPQDMRFSQVDQRNVGDTITSGAQTAGSAIASGAQTAGSAIASGAQTAGSAIASGAQTAGSAISSGAQKAGSAISSGAQKAGSAIASGAVVAGHKIKEGAKVVGNSVVSGAKWAGEGIKTGGTKFVNAVKKVDWEGTAKTAGEGIVAGGKAAAKGGAAFYNEFLTGEDASIPPPPPKANPSQYKVKPIDIEDCTACKFIWNQVEMDVGNTPLEEEVFKSFQSNCAEASLSRIFYPSCNLMSNHIQDFIIDYNKGFDPNQMCEHNGMCRNSLLFYPDKKPKTE